MEQHFDISRIIGIELRGITKTSHRWLPKKQKTFFFGLIKRNAWHAEGYYENGCYDECYESGCWDATEYNAKELRDYGYIVDESTKTVYDKPHATIFMESDCKVYKKFDTEPEATEWVNALKKRSGKEFEIVIK